MTGSASSPEHGPTPDGLDTLATFLASNDALQDRLYSYISRRIRGDQHGAEEAHQDTLVAFDFHLRTKGCVPCEYAPLIFGIARNVVAEYWRKRRQRTGVILTPPSDLALVASVLSPKTTDPFEPVDTALDLKCAFGRLSEEQRHALVLLHYVDGLTQEEAAGEMGITRGRLRRLVASARRQILVDGTLEGYRTHETTIPMRRPIQTGTSEVQA